MAMNFREKITILSALSVFFGILLGTLILFFEFQNNNNNEYFDNASGIVDIPYSALTLGFYGLFGAIATFVAGTIVLITFALLRRIRRAG